jgi:hypothetical protein
VRVFSNAQTRSERSGMLKVGQGEEVIGR